MNVAMAFLNRPCLIMIPDKATILETCVGLLLLASITRHNTKQHWGLYIKLQYTLQQHQQRPDILQGPFLLDLSFPTIYCDIHLSAASPSETHATAASQNPGAHVRFSSKATVVSAAPSGNTNTTWIKGECHTQRVMVHHDHLKWLGGWFEQSSCLDGRIIVQEIKSTALHSTAICQAELQGLVWKMPVFELFPVTPSVS